MKVVDEQSVTDEDVALAVSSVNEAKNNLCRRHGFPRHRPSLAEE